MPIDCLKINEAQVAGFRFKPFKKEFLLTNDFGEHCFLEKNDFSNFLQAKTALLSDQKLTDLRNKGFFRSHLDLSKLTAKYACRTNFLGQGPSLHIIVLTKRCNHCCVYCQVNAQGVADKGNDMNVQVAEKVISNIFESSNQDLVIEFQGGEPLLNFGCLQYIVECVKKKNNTFRKNIAFSLVTNMSCMDEKKLDFLMQHNVGICTSLDGPQKLHNRYRISSEKNSYQNTIRWIKIIQDQIASGVYPHYFGQLNALATITKEALDYPIEIVEEYFNLGLKGIDLRPVQPFGIIGNNKWQDLVFSAQQFMKFYKQAFNHILKLNKKGSSFYERRALIFLLKILTDNDPNFLDLRSPCGAAIGQLAYDINGDVYTCDEGRMFAAKEPSDYSFRLGNVLENSYEEIIRNETVKILCLASCLDNLPRCSNCVYKPFCGVCPLYSYATEGELVMKGQNKRCKINESTLDFIFDKLKQALSRSKMEEWLKSLYLKRTKLGGQL